MCESCAAKFGNMKKGTGGSKLNQQYIGGAAVGGAATVVGVKLIGKIAGKSLATSAETVTGGGTALGGWLLQSYVKSPFWKGVGLGMMGGGAFVAADKLLGDPLDKLFNPNKLTSSVTNEQALLAALTAGGNNNALTTGGTGGTGLVF